MVATKIAKTRRPAAGRSKKKRGRRRVERAAGQAGGAAAQGSKPAGARVLAAPAASTRGAALAEVTRGTLSADPAAVATGLSLRSATRIVLRAAHDFQGDMDTPLEVAGLITEPQRAAFRQRVFEGVLEAGCRIDAGAIPNAPEVRLSAVRDAVQAHAR